MRAVPVLKFTPHVMALALTGMLFGCAGYEVNNGHGAIPGYLIHTDVQNADRALETARAQGKDKQCPAEFADAEKAKDKAYDVYRACHTDEAIALAKDAIAKANALCPPVAAKPVAAAPVDVLTATPATINKGDSATLTWTSQNATNCDIQPGIGAVPTKGSQVVKPAASTSYTLVCQGEGGAARSTAGVSVMQPAPVVEQPQAAPVAVVEPPKAVVAPKLCKAVVVDIQFDTGKSDIKPKYAKELQKLADFLKANPKAHGDIEGHTDNVGKEAANMKLSQRRADAVRSYLIKKFKVDPKRIVAKGYGPTKPIADNKTKAGKAKNRRIEANFQCE